MNWRRKKPDADGLVLLCTLHWPEPHRYYLSRRYRGRWDLWVLPPGAEHARQWPIGRLSDPETPDREVGIDLLGAYLHATHPGQLPTRDPVPALLDEHDLLVLLATHQVLHQGVN